MNQNNTFAGRTTQKCAFGLVQLILLLLRELLAKLILQLRYQSSPSSKECDRIAD